MPVPIGGDLRTCMKVKCGECGEVQSIYRGEGTLDAPAEFIDPARIAVELAALTKEYDQREALILHSYDISGMRGEPKVKEKTKREWIKGSPPPDFYTGRHE